MGRIHVSQRRCTNINYTKQIINMHYGILSNLHMRRKKKLVRYCRHLNLSPVHIENMETSVKTAAVPELNPPHTHPQPLSLVQTRPQSNSGPGFFFKCVKLTDR